MADEEVTTADLTTAIARALPTDSLYLYGPSIGALAERIAAVLLASFVVVPKGQLHQETAEQASPASGDLREQTKPQGDSASVPLDRIAQAIAASMEEQCSFEHVGLIGAHVDWKQVATAAVASLELHQETATEFVWVPNDPPEMDNRRVAAVLKGSVKQIAKVRLVGPWRPTDSKEKRSD